MNYQKSLPFKIFQAISLPLLTSGITLSLTTHVLWAEGIPPNWGDRRAYEPPAGMGTPGRRESAGTRGGCLQSPKALTALVPLNSYGVTVAAYPTFFFYLPQMASKQMLEFSLENDTDNSNVYKASFQSSGKPGIISISLPASTGLAPLEVNKNYHWQFSIICNNTINDGDQGGNSVVEGRVRRVKLTPALNRQLQAANAKEKARLYAESEIWFDALKTLADIRRSPSQNFSSTVDWEKLLRSVKLDAIAKDSLATE